VVPDGADTAEDVEPPPAPSATEMEETEGPPMGQPVGPPLSGPPSSGPDTPPSTAPPVTPPATAPAGSGPWCSPWSGGRVVKETVLAMGTQDVLGQLVGPQLGRKGLLTRRTD